MTMQGGANSAQLGAGLMNSFAAFQQTRAARKGMREQARFIEQVAEQEAQAILQAGDERLKAFSQRASEILDEEALNQQQGAQRAREARDIGDLMIANIQARSASKGVSLTEGTPLELEAQAAFEAEHVAATEELQTKLLSKNLLTKAKQEMEAGQAARFSAKMQARSTILTAKAQATGIRTQAPGPFDAIMAAIKPLEALDKDKAEAGLEPILKQFRPRNVSSKPSLLSSTPQISDEPRIYGDL